MKVLKNIMKERTIEMLENVVAEEVITKVFEIPYYDKKKKRHKLYKVQGKVGTTCSTIVYFVDKIPDLNEPCFFIDGGCMTAVLAGGIEKLNQYVITDLVQLIWLMKKVVVLLRKGGKYG